MTGGITEDRMRTIYAYPGLVYDLEIRQMVEEIRAARSSDSRKPAKAIREGSK